MVTVDVEGGDDVKKALAGVIESIRSGTHSELDAEADRVVTDARAAVRVDTGDLQRSITSEVSDDSATVAPRPELMAGPFVKALINEFGRSRDPGQPYMVPASEASRARWPQRAGDAVRKAAKG